MLKDDKYFNIDTYIYIYIYAKNLCWAKVFIYSQIAIDTPYIKIRHDVFMETLDESWSNWCLGISWLQRMYGKGESKTWVPDMVEYVVNGL